MKLKISHYFYITTGALLFLHSAGIAFHWYDTFYSFDKIVHAFGGAWVAEVLLILSARYQILSFPRDRYITACIILISMAMLVGVFWEFFELAVDKISLAKYGAGIENHPAPTDTAFDLLADFLGISFTAFMLLSKKR